MKIDYKVKKLILKKTWKLSRNAADIKENLILSITFNDFESRSEIAPNIRYNESPQLACSEIDSFNSLINNSKDIDQIISLIPNNISHSTRFGIESLLLNLKCKMNSSDLCSELTIAPPKRIKTSFSFPIMSKEELKEYLLANDEYESYKIKIDQDSALETVKKVASLTSQKLRIDANEGFSSASEFLEFYEQVKDLNIEFIEQPFKSTDVESYLEIKGKTTFPIIADESIESNVDFDQIEKCFDGVNVKLMKAGGLRNAVALLKEAKRRNLKTMVGCMIETSIGIKYAMILNSLADYVDLDGHLLIKNDDFNLIGKEKGELFLVPPYTI